MSRSPTSTARSSDTSLDSLPPGFYFNHSIVDVKWKGSGASRKLQVSYESGAKEKVTDLEDLSVYKILRDAEDVTARVNEKSSIATLVSWMLSNNVRISSGKTCWNRIGDTTGHAVDASRGVLYYSTQPKTVSGHATSSHAPSIHGIHLQPEARDEAGNVTNRITLQPETLYNIAGLTEDSLTGGTNCPGPLGTTALPALNSPPEVERCPRRGMLALGQLRRIVPSPRAALVTTSLEGSHIAGGMRGGVLTFAYSYTDGMVRPAVCEDYLRYGDSRHCKGSSQRPTFCCRTRKEGGVLLDTTKLEVYDVTIDDNAELKRLNKAVHRAVKLLMQNTPSGARVDVPGILADYTQLAVRDVMLSLYSLGLLDSLMGGPNCGYSCDPDYGKFISTRVHTAGEVRGTVFAETSTNDWVNLNTGEVGSMVRIAADRYDMINISGRSDTVPEGSCVGRMDLGFKVFRDCLNAGGILRARRGSMAYALPQKCQESMSANTMVGQLFPEPRDAVTAVGIVLGNLEGGWRSYAMGALQDAGCDMKYIEKIRKCTHSQTKDDYWWLMQSEECPASKTDNDVPRQVSIREGGGLSPREDLLDRWEQWRRSQSTW